MTRSRVIWAILAALVAGGAATAFAIAWRPAFAAIDPPQPQSFDVARVKRGRELAAIGNCDVCHTIPGGKFYAASDESVIIEAIKDIDSRSAGRVEVSKSQRTVSAYDGDGKLLAQYPATTGSEHDPLPIGDWKIAVVQQNPWFNYNPDLFWDANPKDTEARISPGPNNPVGVVWMGLSKEHYGIHGTPNHGTIGHAESHGCIRLTNWDAEELSQMVLALVWPVVLGLDRIETSSLLRAKGTLPFLTGLPSFPDPPTLRRFLLRAPASFAQQLGRVNDRLLQFFMHSPPAIPTDPRSREYRSHRVWPAGRRGGRRQSPPTAASVPTSPSWAWRPTPPIWVRPNSHPVTSTPTAAPSNCSAAAGVTGPLTFAK